MKKSRVRRERHLNWLVEPWSEFAFHRRPGRVDFRVMRRDVASLTQCQCAELLGVYRSTVQAWESGRKGVPFMAYHLLRCAVENRSFRLHHSEWEGWCVSRMGKLCDPGHLYEFTPEELGGLWIRFQVLGKLEREVKDLTSRLVAAVGENTSLRSSIRDGGLVDEVAEIRARLDGVFSRINTAKVVELRVAA